MTLMSRARAKNARPAVVASRTQKLKAGGRHQALPLLHVKNLFLSFAHRPPRGRSPHS